MQNAGFKLKTKILTIRKVKRGKYEQFISSSSFSPPFFFPLLLLLFLFVSFGASLIVTLSIMLFLCGIHEFLSMGPIMCELIFLHSSHTVQRI